MYEHILVPTDGGKGTIQVVEHMLEPAGGESAVHTLSVADQRVYLAAGGDRQDAVVQSLCNNTIGAIERCVEECEGEVSTTTVIRDGVPHRVILNYAGEHGVNVIVMGVHERTGCDKFTSLGSVTERVIENAKRLVLVTHID